MQVKTGSRGGGQSARAKIDYVLREGKYANKDASPDEDASPDKDEREHVEHGNMPAWAQDPRAYWSAADEHERANGSLFKEVVVALPVELSSDERRDLAHRFAVDLTDAPEGKLPYTLAIHKGEQDNPDPGEQDNPHAHIVMSERAHDGRDRDEEQWFKRANSKAPEKGGAKKTRAMMEKSWLPEVRAKWEQMANRALEQAGREERIDHRTLVAQRAEALAISQDPKQSDEDRQRAQARAAELDREPTEHDGCKPHMLERQLAKLDTEPPAGLRARDDARQLAQVEPQEEQTQQRISWLERELEHIGERIRSWREYIDERARETAERVREMMRPRTPQPSRDEGIER